MFLKSGLWWTILLELWTVTIYCACHTKWGALSNDSSCLHVQPWFSEVLNFVFVGHFCLCGLNDAVDGWGGGVGWGGWWRSLLIESAMKDDVRETWWCYVDCLGMGGTDVLVDGKRRWCSWVDVLKFQGEWGGNNVSCWWQTKMMFLGGWCTFFKGVMMFVVDGKRRWCSWADDVFWKSAIEKRSAKGFGKGNKNLRTFYRHRVSTQFSCTTHDPLGGGCDPLFLYCLFWKKAPAVLRIGIQTHEGLEDWDGWKYMEISFASFLILECLGINEQLSELVVNHILGVKQLGPS